MKLGSLRDRIANQVEVLRNLRAESVKLCRTKLQVAELSQITAKNLREADCKFSLRGCDLLISCTLADPCSRIGFEECSQY